MKTWIKVANSDDVSANGGGCVKLGGVHGGVQIAVFKLRPPGGETTWYAVQNLCPHDHRQVFSSGLTGDAQGELKVACPLHKNAFSLRTGAHLGDQAWMLETFPVKEVEGGVLLEADTARLTPPPANIATEVNREPDDACGHALPN